MTKNGFRARFMTQNLDTPIYEGPILLRRNIGERFEIFNSEIQLLRKINVIWKVKALS